MRKIKPKVNDYMSPSSVGLKKAKSRPIYPTFRIDLDYLPEAKDWKVGKSYEITMTVKMVGLSQSRFENSAEFEIREVGTKESDKKYDDESSDESDANEPVDEDD